MLVYRLSRTKFASDLSGEGSRLKGGRWNNKKTGCVYTSESRALAILEYTANVNIDEIPRAMSMITIRIPDESIFCPEIASLPGNWHDIPTPSSTKEFGTMLLAKKEYATIRVPSVLIPQEFNYILNPLHSLSSRFKIELIADFIYDVRIKLL